MSSQAQHSRLASAASPSSASDAASASTHVHADLAALYSRFEGSHAQLNQLGSVLRTQTAPPLVHLHGAAGVGKTAMLTSILETRKLPYAYIDCVECSAERSMCEAIASQLLHLAPRNSPLSVVLHPELYELAEAPRKRRPCTSVSDLARFFDSMVPECATSAGLGTIYIVLDNCHKLLDSLLSLSGAPISINTGGSVGRFFISLIHLPDLIHPRGAVDLCVTLVSQGAMTRGHSFGLRSVEPLFISFPALSKPAILHILSDLNSPDEFQSKRSSALPVALFNSFIDHILSLLGTSMRDAAEIRHIVRLLLPHYIDALGGDSNLDDLSGTAIRNALLSLRSSLLLITQNLYLHHLSTNDLQPARIQQARLHESSTSTTHAESFIRLSPAPVKPTASSPSRASLLASTSTSTSATTTASSISDALSLPRHTALLLIAAFLASHNPAQLDLKYFSTQSTRKRRVRVTAMKSVKSAKTASGRSNPSSGAFIGQRLLGPRPFTLDRLVAIYRAICDAHGEVRSSSRSSTTGGGIGGNFYAQLSALVSLNLIAHMGASGDPLAHSRMRCNITHEVAQQVSESCNFELHNYMFNDE